MTFRLLFISFWIAVLPVGALAQAVPRRAPSRRPTVPRPTPAPAAVALIPTIQQEVPGLVYIHQRIELRKNEALNMTLDGEPATTMSTKNVTLGLVIDNEGHVVTRLVGVTPGSPPLEITVLMQRVGKPLQAVFLGLDSATGLCVLKCDAAALKAPAFSDLTVLPNQRAIKLYGFHPHQGQSQTPAMTNSRPRIHSFAGQIVKAVRDFRFNVNNPIYRLLAPQLTAAQDGGIVLDSAGDVFGIAVFDTSGEGNDLAYPITRIRAVAEKVIKANDSIAYGWLGARGIDMPSSIETAIPRHNRPTERGVIVIDVFPDSPAEAAGVQPKDILLKVNDRDVETRAQLSSALRQIPPDSEISLKLKRGGEYKFLKAKLVPAPAVEPSQELPALIRRLDNMKQALQDTPTNDPRHQQLAAKVETMASILQSIAKPAPPDVKLRVFYGLETQPLTAQLLHYFAVPNGVLVAAVSTAHKAAQAGLRAGDVIVKIGASAVKDDASLLLALDGAAAPASEITVMRRRETLKLTFTR